MSFSYDVKKELCALPVESSCCALAELAGIVSFCGNFVSSSEKTALRIRTENFDVAKRIRMLLEKTLGFCEDITERAKKNGDSTFTIYVYEKKRLDSLVSKLGLVVNGVYKFNINPFLINDECCKRAYIRGAFLGGGSVTSPNKSYHFEIETHYRGLSRDFTQLLCDEEIPVKTVVRKSEYVTYLKDSDEIADLIALMGATDAMFELYNIKMEKNVKNKINRQINCEMANIQKISDAAAKQISAIKKIMSKNDVELSENLRELAALRIEYPELSLKELGAMLNPPISKSGVNHRLNKIMAMAEK